MNKQTNTTQTKCLLELILSEVAGHKIDIQNQLHFYTPTIKYPKRNCESNTNHNSMKIIKYVEINITK